MLFNDFSENVSRYYTIGLDPQSRSVTDCSSVKKKKRKKVK